MRKWAVGIVAGMLLGLSAPAVANHIQEPTRPIIDTQLHLYEYRNKAATAITACDGSETYTKTKMRIEGDVIYPTGPAWDGDDKGPSEHFWVTLAVFAPRKSDPRQTSLIWKNQWAHQNVPPHKPGPSGASEWSWEAFEADQWSMPTYGPGLWKVRMRVTGMESGNFHEIVCLFQWAPEE